MTKEEARIVWSAASEYRWRGFDHWWEVEGLKGRPASHEEVVEWIDISKPPESADDVLILYKNGSGMEIASYSKSVFDFPDRRGWTRYNHCCGDNTTIQAKDIIHWAELPKGPKEAKNE
jgi:hypothetical protein